MASHAIRLTLAVLTLALLPLAAESLCVSPVSCGNNWQPFVNPIHHDQTPGPNGFTYFDGFSYDAPDANIADFISGQGYFQGNPASPNAPLPYWGNRDGSALNSFYFHGNGSAMIAEFLDFIGQWAAFNSIGWYDVDSNAWGWIYQSNGTVPNPQSITFTPSVNFGLFFVPDSSTYDPRHSYYFDTSRNGISDTDIAYAAANNITLGPEDFQHFALFDDGNGGFYIGVKDRSLQVGDSDYNDMILRLTSAPEPSLFFLVGSSLLACRRLSSRRRRTDL